MSGRLDVALIAALALGASGCLLVDTDDVGGSPSSGGSPSDGGSPVVGGSPSDGGAGGGPTIGGGGSTGNQGGGPECQLPSECPAPEFYCTDLTCAEGVCGEQLSAAGTTCGENDDLVCDADGFCVECLDDTDCPGNDLCDVKAGVCYNPDTTGDCADSFCLLLPADNTCFGCLQAENGIGGQCQTQFQDCTADGASASCTTCLERFQGEAGAFCAGSQDLFNDYYNCICSSGVCLD